MGRIARLGTALTAIACAAALPAGASAASLRLSPSQVSPGGLTRVFGSAAGGCAAGDTVTLLSRAFPHTHDFAGVPAVFTPAHANGSFSRHVRIPVNRAPGSYQVGARCGGGNLGITRQLRVLAPGLTARRIRIADHPAFVRAVVRFSGGTLGANDAEAVDPDPQDGFAQLLVSHPGIGTTAPLLRRLGVRVRVVQGANRLRVRLRAAPDRFKYLAYRQLHGPERLAIDLYKARPPAGAAQIPGTPASCLSIANHADGGGTIHASGTARGIFENQFTLAVRNARGRIAGRTTVAFGTTAPSWSATVTYSVAIDQPGMLEAADFSARDGALTCIAQIRVPLAAPLASPP